MISNVKRIQLCNIDVTDIHLNQKSLLWSIGVWCLVFGHSLLLVHSGGRRLLGGSVWATVVVDSSMLTPYSQDLRWHLMFVWNLGLSVEEAVFYLGVTTWTVERYRRRYQYLYKTQPPPFIPRGSAQTIQCGCKLRSWEQA